jgi:ribosomal subunit interface protein
MEIPIQITFRGIDVSPAVDEYVRKRAAKLATFSDRITHCRVAVEGPPHHKKHGGNYRVRVELNVPRADLVVARAPDEHVEHQDVYVAIDDAFDHAGRVLQDHVRRQRGETKVHADQR